LEGDDLDRFLSDDDIVPSSGFVARVMEAVYVETTAPPAIPFPWVRALPGIAATVVAFVAVIAGTVSLGSEGSGGPSTSTTRSPDVVFAWLIIVLLLCTVPVMLSLRFTAGRS
jgi:hypothetical protein